MSLLFTAPRLDVASMIVLFPSTVKIRSLLKLTTDLIDICYDHRAGTSNILANESIDFEQISDQFAELRDLLEKLFKAATTNASHQLGIGPSVDLVNGILSRCRNEINELETVLKRESGRKRIQGPSSSFNPQVMLTDLASSTTALRDAMQVNQR